MFWAHVLITRRPKLHYTADDTRGYVMQFWPPDDEHKCSKHVEAWNKLIVKEKFCASGWLITKTNMRYTRFTSIVTIYTQIVLVGFSLPDIPPQVRMRYSSRRPRCL